MEIRKVSIYDVFGNIKDEKARKRLAKTIFNRTIGNLDEFKDFREASKELVSYPLKFGRIAGVLMHRIYTTDIKCSICGRKIGVYRGEIYYLYHAGGFRGDFYYVCVDCKEKMVFEFVKKKFDLL
jgi:DNA-directed RNA polymerase subunit RPC12/RpoP